MIKFVFWRRANLSQAIVTELQRTTEKEALERSQSLMYWKTQSQEAATQLVAALDHSFDGEPLLGIGYV